MEWVWIWKEKEMISEEVVEKYIQKNTGDDPRIVYTLVWLGNATILKHLRSNSFAALAEVSILTYFTELLKNEYYCSFM